ncbi:MAG: S-layer homology domain-containing protein, partial [Clostridia bacterium]|nr:S-layer homology domain-containing protein [Clostridia bacterium]
MSTMKKILSLTLALAMLMSVSVFAGFADAAEIDKDATEAVNLLAAVNILNGIPQEDGTTDFAPAATIKRAEAAKMIYVLRNGGKDDGATTWKGVVTFADCKDHWAAGYIAYCEAYGIINGRTETVFDPEAPVTGIELAKMLLTTAGYKTEAEGFTGANWEKNVVAEANAVNLFAGVKFAITDAAPRQWAAVMFKNAFEVNVPTYIGDYRVDGILNGVQAISVKEKFLKLTEAEAVVLATKTASVTGTYATAATKTLLKVGTEIGEVDFTVADALVGQQVKVAVYNDESILGIVATGKAVIGELKVGAKITSGTDKDKYPVTVGGTTIGNKATTDVICGTLTVQNVLDQQAKKGNWVAYTAYDVDGNKTVDY